MPQEDRLETAFVAEITVAERSQLGFGLRGQIEAAVARGRAAFPDLRVADEAFARHLGRALKRMSDAAAIADLEAEDLYLACACLTTVAGAASTLIQRYGDVMGRVVVRVAGKSPAEEIVQALVSDLLVGSIDSPPQITDYAGRAPLARWLEIVAKRAALMWLRSERTKANVAGRAGMEPRLAIDTPAEAALFRERYEADFGRAVEETLRRVPDQDRALLRLYFVDNLSTESIGKMLGVTQPTASRRLKKARARILSDFKLVLRQRLKISSGEIESLASLASSRLDLSITQFLK